MKWPLRLMPVVLAGCTFGSESPNVGRVPQLGEPDMEMEPGPDAPEPEPEPDPPRPDAPSDDPYDDAGDGTGTDGGDGAEPRPDGDLPPPRDPPADDPTGGADEDPPVECPTAHTELLWAEDAMTVAPMFLATATGATGEPLVAICEVAEDGEVVFSLDLPCAGDYYVHGLTWDYSPGAWGDLDPDSLYVGTGGPTMFTWRYGCQTGGMTEALGWQPLQRLDAQPCSTTPIVLSAPEAGTYELTFRNREAGSGSVVAGLGAIVVTTDPSLDPYDLYDPY